MEYYNPTSGYSEIGVFTSSVGDEGYWSKIKTASDSTHNLRFPSIAIDPASNDIFVAVEREWTSSNHDILVLRYVDGVWSWSPVDIDSGDDRHPSITSEYQYGAGNWQYISYEYLYSYDDRDLMFATSEDHGVTWSTEKLRGDGPDYNVHAQTSITNAEGYIYIAYKWGADYDSPCEIRVDRSTDFGDTWSQYTNIDGLPNGCSFPAIAATHGGGRVVAAFQYAYSASDIDVCYSYSTDKGTSWTKSIFLFSSPSENETMPAIAADGGGMASDDIYGYFHALCQSDHYIKYRKTRYNNLRWQHLWSQHQVVNAERWIYSGLAVTTQFRNGSGQFYPCVTWIDNRPRDWGWRNGYTLYYSTPGADYYFNSDPVDKDSHSIPPAGRTIEIDGNPSHHARTFNWIAGYNHSLYAPSPQYANSTMRYVFESWSDSGAQFHIITAGTSDQSITAYFNVQYYLSVTVDPSDLSPLPTASPLGPWYTNGTSVNLTAQDISGCTFDHWTVDEANQGQGVNPITIIMNEPHNATACYLCEHDLSVAVDAPNFLEPSDSALLNATVYNSGLSNETDVELQLLINGSIVNAATIPELPSGSSYTLSYLWIPTVVAMYNVTAYAPPLLGEVSTINNRDTKFVTVCFLPVHNLNTSLDYPTIQTAIDATETFGGHRILVDAGIYYEHLVVNKSVSLIGEDPHSTIVDGGGSGDVITVRAKNIVVENFTIRNGYHGITMRHEGPASPLNNCIIRNNVITNNNGTGILCGVAYWTWVSNSAISGNNITANDGSGIHVCGENNTLSGNNIKGNVGGISLQFSVSNTISENNITANNRYGIGLDESIDHTISGNNIAANNGSGIGLGASRGNIISGNNIAANNNSGIVLDFHSMGNNVSGNNITNNDYGISFWFDGSGNIVCGNNVTNNNVGIYLQGSSEDNYIYHNNFINNIQQVDSTSGYDNVWDDGYPSGGNYWSD
jgi:nitrous oxidase accessory protein